MQFSIVSKNVLRSFETVDKALTEIARPGKGGRAEVCNSRECGFVFRNDRHRNLLALNSHKIKRNRIYCFGICLNYLISRNYTFCQMHFRFLFISPSGNMAYFDLKYAI